MKTQSPAPGGVAPHSTPGDELCNLITHLSSMATAYELALVATMHAAEQYHVDPILVAASRERGRRLGYRAAATIGHERLLVEMVD